MSLPKCLTDNNKVHKYDAAFPLNSKLTISPRLKFIGVGVIVEVDGKRYFGKDRLKFYKKRAKQPLTKQRLAEALEK